MNDSTTISLSIIVSLLIHIAALFLIMLQPASTSPTPPAKQQQESFLSVELAPLPTPTNYSASLQPGTHGYKYDKEVCKDENSTYAGAGILIEIGPDLITKAPPQYPAYKAGMRVGDFIMNPLSVNVVNGYMDFRVLRHTTYMEFHVQADHICYQEHKIG